MSHIFNKVKGIFAFLPVLLMMATLLVSCKEENDKEDEYSNWQNKNETYWRNLYNETKAKIDGGDQTWKIIPAISYSTAKDVPAERCIIVHVNQSGNEDSGMPIQTDEVRVHYRGHLLPSLTYTSGYQFDSSWVGEFNPATAKPIDLGVSDVIDGFQTALQHMHIDDDWDVYIPYQLGYGTTQNTTSGIPAYSTLIFRILLTDFWHAGETRSSL